MNNTLLKLITIQLKNFIREPEIIFWAVLFPICLSTVLGLAFVQDTAPARKVAIVEDVSEKVAISLFYKKLPATSFHLIKCTEKEALLKLKRGEAQLYAKFKSGKPTFFFDPKNSEAHLTYLLVEKELNRDRTQVASAVAITAKGNRYIDFLIPGLIALGIMNSCIWGIGWNLIDARIKKLLRRMVATPMKKSVFLAAHMVTRLIASFAEAAILFFFSFVVFGVEIQGSFLAIILLFVAGTFSFAGIGVLISSRAENPQVGNGLINAVVLPMTIVSGVFFSYHNFPEWIENIVRFLPLTILADNLRAVFNEGAGLAQVFVPSLILILIGFVTFVSGLRIYKWY